MTERPKHYQILFAELKRRHVFKVAAVYGAVAFAVMQAADIAFPRFGLPDWTVTFVVALLAVGLPIAVVLAWALELTPEGVRKTDPAASGELEAIVAQPPARRWPAGLFALAGIALLALGGWWVYGDAGAAGADVSGPPPGRSIAVLPFANMSGDPENEYFSDGITDDIITHLSKLADLKVISRTSVMRFKESDKSLRQIAGELGVATILEGGVQRSGDRVRINAQLIDAATDDHLWAEQYNRELTDVFEIQTDVALQIAGALQARLSPEERGRVERRPTEDLQAYNLYLQGRYFWNKRTPEGLRAAIDYFEQALEIDPDYALAWVGLADSYSIMANWGYLSPQETHAKAKSAALEALEIDEALGEAHIALAQIVQGYEWDMEEAQAEYLRGLALSPGYATGHHWYGNLLAILGRDDEAVRELERSLELDPLSLIINQSLGSSLRMAGEHELAIQQLEKVQQLDPNFAGPYQEIGFTYEDMNAFEDAIGAYQRALELSDELIGIGELGHIYGVMGRTEDALEMLRELEEQATTRYVSPIEFAIIYAGLGETDLAFESIERGLEEGDATLLWRLDTPGFKELGSDPRFAQLRSRLGLGEFRLP
jgi:TolB-like protein/Tfp pilus assembly protein PilF